MNPTSTPGRLPSSDGLTPPPKTATSRRTVSFPGTNHSHRLPSDPRPNETSQRLRGWRWIRFTSSSACRRPPGVENRPQTLRTVPFSVVPVASWARHFLHHQGGGFGSVQEREDSKGEDKEYAEIVRKQVSASKEEAEEDGVKVLAALTEPCTSTSGPSSDSSSYLLYDDFTTTT